MEFVLNRNYCLRSTSGHMINFAKGQPTYVPPVCHREAVSIGAEPVEGKVEMLDPEKVEAVPLTQAERDELMFAAFVKMEADNVRGTFTAQGLPNVEKLEHLTGLEEITAHERNEAWQKYREAKAG